MTSLTTEERNKHHHVTTQCDDTRQSVLLSL